MHATLGGWVVVVVDGCGGGGREGGRQGWMDGWTDGSGDFALLLLSPSQQHNDDDKELPALIHPGLSAGESTPFGR